MAKKEKITVKDGENEIQVDQETGEILNTTAPAEYKKPAKPKVKDVFKPETEFTVTKPAKALPKKVFSLDSYKSERNLGGVAFKPQQWLELSQAFKDAT